MYKKDEQVPKPSYQNSNSEENLSNSSYEKLTSPTYRPETSYIKPYEQRSVYKSST